MKYTLTLDSSQLNTFDGFCNLAWAYAYRENIRLTTQKTQAMDSGTLAHEILEYYYQDRGLNPTHDPFQSATIAINEFRDKKKYIELGFNEDYATWLCKRFNQYIAFWLGRDLRPFVLNGRPATELGFSKKLYEDENVLFVVEGKIDLITVVNDTEGILAICDHKSQDRESHYYYYRPQMLTYAWAARDLGIKYGIINYFGMQKEMHARTFRRDTMQLPEWMLNRWEAYMLNIFWKIAQIERKDHYSEYSTEMLYERRLTSCGGAFETHPCSYTDLCESNSFEQRDAIKKFKFHKVEPWKPWKLKEQM